MDLDDPHQRLAFRRSLFELGLSEVQHRLATGKYAGSKAAVVASWIDDVRSGRARADELTFIADQVEALKPNFVDGAWGLYLPSDDQAHFKGLYLEAITLIKEQFGTSNDFSRTLHSEHSSGTLAVQGGPSFSCLSNMVAIIRLAAKSVHRRTDSVGAVVAPFKGAPEIFVEASRIDDLRHLKGSFDFARLITLCNELNSNYAANNFFSCAFLIRAIIDHIPPIFGQTTFKGVVGQHGSKSFKASMANLDLSMRRIADGYLHEHIRSKESVPTAVSVDVKRELDLLLAEIVRHS